MDGMSTESKESDSARMVSLTEGLYLHRGAINVGIIREGDRAALIDCGDGEVIAALDELGIRHVEVVYFTHHHRDQASGLDQVISYSRSPTHVIVPVLERAFFDNVEHFWNDPAFHWHLYNFHPHNLMLARSIEVQGVCGEPDRFAFGRWSIQVLDTPGHTDGSVSYLVDSTAERFVFSGDVIYASGQVWDAYSLQHGDTFGARTLRDYHGFLGARKALASSLVKLRAAGASALIPSHGLVMDAPVAAVDALRVNLDACYMAYARISALRHYFPEVFAEFGVRTDFMPIRSGDPLPPFVHHVGTTFVVVSQDGPALVMDCESPAVIDAVRRLSADGQISGVDAFWISHYHDDHVDSVPAFQEAYPAPTFSDAHVAAVVTEPWAYRLPCLSPAVARIDRRTASGESWQWREFRLTSYHFPGQTFYHGALLVEGRGLRLFFIGDSFTMAGIDDYCAGNRNFLGADQGFDACLGLVERLRPDYLFNCHVDVAFSFTPEQIHAMRANLAQREELFRRLLPWDHPNYGLDEHWIRCHPYAQQMYPGQVAQLTLVVANHSRLERDAWGRLVLPEGWGTGGTEMVTIPSRREGTLNYTFRVPDEAPAGRYVIPVAVEYDGRRLGQFREATVQVEPSG